VLILFIPIQKPRFGADIDEKGTLKATDQDKYEHIAGLV
jgi:hypothetical protein